MNNNQIDFILDKLWKCLKEKKSPLINYLKDGVPKDYMGHVLNEKSLHFEFPDEVLRLYAWKTGIEDVLCNKDVTVGELLLFPTAVYVSFDLAVTTYFYTQRNIDLISKTMFPLFISGSNDFYLIECDPQAKNYKQILFYSFYDPLVFEGPKSKFDSLPSLLSTLLECYEKNILFYDNDEDGVNRLDVDIVLYNQVCIKHNPHSDYWEVGRK